jgi:hypothetical protein
MLAVLAIACSWFLMGVWIVIWQPLLWSPWLFVVPAVLVVVAIWGLLLGDPRS